jgi:hypothetical protein
MVSGSLDQEKKKDETKEGSMQVVFSLVFTSERHAGGFTLRAQEIRHQRLSRAELCPVSTSQTNASPSNSIFCFVVKE